MKKFLIYTFALVALGLFLRGAGVYTGALDKGVGGFRKLYLALVTGKRSE